MFVPRPLHARAAGAALCLVALATAAGPPRPAQALDTAAPAADSAAAAPAPAAATDTAAAAAAPAGFTLSAELDGNSCYVWRGLRLSDGAVLNPSVTAGWGATSLNLWSNVAAERRAAPALDELDATLATSLTLAGFALRPNLLVYTYNDGEPATGELFLEIAHPLHGPLGTFVRRAQDVSRHLGSSYSSAGVSASLPGWHGWALAGEASAARGSAAFASVYVDPAFDRLSVLDANASATWTARGGAYVRVHADWSRAGAAFSGARIPDPAPFAAGVALGWAPPGAP